MGVTVEAAMEMAVVMAVVMAVEMALAVVVVMVEGWSQSHLSKSVRLPDARPRLQEAIQVRAQTSPTDTRSGIPQPLKRAETSWERQRY